MLNTGELKEKLNDNKIPERNDFLNNYLKVLQAGFPPFN